ncbi:AI-2E family transporter [Sphingomonas sp.]|jgi:predicted PurR-regulated permease PerM|uniref:AI-2E family transporter n=1 Tax=Sphingomonas sp. TaxID=28214 RepID=UPI002E2F4DFA|nr:AI-2E family transporter [Sphingomonas sp.]HEX4693198.1 AI-2E family transporter [Sphingomonas sp.]
MKRLTPDADDARFIRRVVLLIVIGAITIALYRAGDLLILAFGSILGAITIRAVAARFRKHLHLPHRLSLALAMLTAPLFVAFLIWLLTVQFGTQINALIAETPMLIDRLAAWMAQSTLGAKIVDAARAAYAGSQAAQDVGAVARTGATVVLNVVLLVVGALFFAVEPRRYRNGLLLLVPKNKRPAFGDALADLARTLRLWLRAQLLLMTIMGVLIGLGLWISGVPSAAALGLLAGMSEFIPYIGPTVAMLPALGLAAATGTGPLVGAIATFAVVRLVHDNGITPYVQSRVVQIPPAVTLFAIVAMGLIFGVIGLVFSAPLLVAIYALTRSLYLRETIGEDLPRPD